MKKSLTAVSAVRARKRFALLVLMSVSLFLSASAQSPMFNQRDDKYRLLGLKRAKEAYEVAQKDFARQESLYVKGLISEVERDRAKNAEADAEVNYQQSLLAVLFENQYVTVDQAVKFQARDGSKHVRLTVANASGATEEFEKLINIEDKLFRSLQPDIVNYVYVALVNADGSIISRPYEAKIERLRHGEPRQIDFALLQDVDAVTVNLVYGNGTTRSMKVFLQKDATANKVLVQSEQFSQEAELGKSATFDLSLEQFSGSFRPFSLEVVNLPRQLTKYFKDPSTEARLAQIRFAENTNSRKVSLVVSLPDRATADVPMDAPMSFYVLIVPADRAAAVSSAGEKNWSVNEIEKLNVGYVKLELVPRGKGRLLVRAPQLYYSIRPDEKLSMRVELVNEGTQKLDNIEVKIDPPMNWTKSVDPPLVPTLEVGEEKTVTIECAPPPGTSAGRYEVRLRTTALSDTQPINAEDKTVTVELQGEASVVVTGLIVLLILGVVGGIVVFGIRLSKR